MEYIYDIKFLIKVYVNASATPSLHPHDLRWNTVWLFTAPTVSIVGLLPSYISHLFARCRQVQRVWLGSFVGTHSIYLHLAVWGCVFMQPFSNSTAAVCPLPPVISPLSAWFLKQLHGFLKLYIHTYIHTILWDIQLADVLYPSN